MYTLGYSFKPWTKPKAIADGPSILEYLRETAKSNGVDKRIRFGHRVKRASWSSHDARWTVEAERGPDREPVRFTCSFLFMCSGYYNYAEGYTPQFPGAERFAGRIVHPQKWTRGHRLRQQARRRHRQRCDSGDDRAGDGEDRCARDDAATLADLRHLDACRGLHCERPAAPAADEARVPADALEERAVRHAVLPAEPPPARAHQEADPQRRAQGGSVPTTTSARISRRATTRGISACASCRTATCSKRSRRAASTSSRTRSRRSRRRASRCARASSWKRT